MDFFRDCCSVPKNSLTVERFDEALNSAPEHWGRGLGGPIQLGRAAAAAGELYAYGNCDVMFKPTKAAEYRFRPTAGEANVVEGGYQEDGGFVWHRPCHGHL